jgi:HNH endonuclease.
MRATNNQQCKPCKNLNGVAWRRRNPERVRQFNQDYQAAHGAEMRAKQAEYRADPENKELARQRTRTWYHANKQRAAEWQTLYAERRRPLAAARHKKRMREDPAYAEKWRLNVRIQRARRRVAEGATLSEHFAAEIAAIYAACPPGMEVDHIHPLQGKNASGLHVPWNLQYLPRLENRIKSNKLKEG